MISVLCTFLDLCSKLRGTTEQAFNAVFCQSERTHASKVDTYYSGLWVGENFSLHIIVHFTLCTSLL